MRVLGYIMGDPECYLTVFWLYPESSVGFKERQWLSLASAPEPDQMKNTTQEDICPLLVREEEGIGLGSRKVFEMWSWQVPGTDQR